MKKLYVFECMVTLRNSRWRHNLFPKEIKYYIVHFKDMNMEAMHQNAPCVRNYNP